MIKRFFIWIAIAISFFGLIFYKPVMAQDSEPGDPQEEEECYSCYAKVLLAHFAPFGDAQKPGSTAVSVVVDGKKILENFEFTQMSGPSKLGPGSHTVKVYSSGSANLLLSDEVYLERGDDYTLAVIGDGTNQPLELYLIERDTVPDPDKAKLFLGHVAPFAKELSATAVDICTSDGLPIIENMVYKQFTDPYLYLPAGDIHWQVRLAGTPACSGELALQMPSIRLAAGEIVELYLVGSANNWPLSVVSTTGYKRTPAAVDFAHFAPFANANIAGSTLVSVRVDGTEVLSGIEFGEIFQGLELASGDHTIEIVPNGAAAAAISGVVSLEGEKKYTLAAIGDGVNQPLELFLLVDDLTLPAAGQTRLRIAHFAPFAASLDDLRVDICTTGNTVLVADLPYKGFTDPYLTIASGFYDLKVTHAGTSCNGVLFDIPILYLPDRQVASLYLIGGTNGWEAGASTLPALKAHLLYFPAAYPRP